MKLFRILLPNHSLPTHCTAAELVVLSGICHDLESARIQVREKGLMSFGWEDEFEPSEFHFDPEQSYVFMPMQFQVGEDFLVRFEFY